MSAGWSALGGGPSSWWGAGGDRPAAIAPLMWAALAFIRRHSDGTPELPKESAASSGEPAELAAEAFPIHDLGNGLYEVSDPTALSQVFGRSGILGHVSLTADGDPSPSTGTVAFDFTGSELGIRVAGTDYTILEPTKAYPLDTLQDAEKSLLLSTSPFAYNHDSAGQAIVNPITGLYEYPVSKGDVVEFWYTAPNGNKVYSSTSPERFTLTSGGAYGTLRVNADALFNEEGDPLFTNYALSSFTQQLDSGTRYTVRLSSASKQKNVLKIYTVDDATGSIDGVLPWQEGYAALAAQRVVRSYKAPRFLKTSEFSNLRVSTDGFVSSYLQTADGEKLFPWSQANPGGTDSLIRLSDKGFAYDDGSGGAVKDYQDLIFSLEPTSVAKSADLIITAKRVTAQTWFARVTQTANAIAIKDGVIIGVGNAWRMQRLFEGDATIVERHDESFLYPGFVDPHEHLFTLASYGTIPSNTNITWPANPDNINTYENVTKVLIQELADFERQHKDDPGAWYGAFGLDPSILGNPAGSTSTDSLATIYKEAFTMPPKELVTATPGYGSGQTYINWLTYIADEAEKIEPGASQRRIAIFYSSGHGIAVNAAGVEELTKLEQKYPEFNFSILQQYNPTPNEGQPSYLTDAIGGYFLRDGEYGQVGYFTGVALEPNALAPITEAFNASRLSDIYGQLGTNLKANSLNHASVGITTANDKSFGSMTGSPTTDFQLQGLLESSGYQPIRLLVDPLSGFIFDKEQQVKPNFQLTPFQGNLSASPKAIKFMLDGSNQAMTGYMPADDPYVVKGNSGDTYNPSFVLFQETASGWQPIGMRDIPIPPGPGEVNDGLNAQLQQLWDLGWGFHAHTNGQQATTAMIDAYKKLYQQGGSQAKGSPPQILGLEHLPFATDKQLRDLGRIGGFASFTKGHLQHAYQFGWNGDSYEGTGVVGKDRGNAIVRAKTALLDGVNVSMHSDFPIDWVGSLTSPLDPSITFKMGPLDFMAELSERTLTAITRSANNPTTVVNPWQRLSRRQAFLATTLWSAENMSFDPWIGSLSVGKLADMTLMDSNILSCRVPLRYATPDQTGVNVLKTWVGGNVVYTI